MEKMREEFDAWFDANHKTENASLNFAIGEAMWSAWKASRTALCVELPQPEMGHGNNITPIDVEIALDKAGVSYK